MPAAICYAAADAAIAADAICFRCFRHFDADTPPPFRHAMRHAYAAAMLPPLLTPYLCYAFALMLIGT